MENVKEHARNSSVTWSGGFRPGFKIFVEKPCASTRRKRTVSPPCLTVFSFEFQFSGESYVTEKASAVPNSGWKEGMGTFDAQITRERAGGGTGGL